MGVIMIVLNKKRLIIITMCVFISIFACILSTTKESSEEVVSVVSLPVSGKTIILDAGHGIPDERDKMLKF